MTPGGSGTQMKLGSSGSMLHLVKPVEVKFQIWRYTFWEQPRNGVVPFDPLVEVRVVHEVIQGDSGHGTLII